MPSWDYRCRSCGSVSTLQFRNAEERDKHEEDRIYFVCGAYRPETEDRPSGFCTGTLERQWPAPNFKLVGFGFHCVDYKDKK